MDCTVLFHIWLVLLSYIHWYFVVVLPDIWIQDLAYPGVNGQKRAAWQQQGEQRFDGRCPRQLLNLDASVCSVKDEVHEELNP